MFSSLEQRCYQTYYSAKGNLSLPPLLQVNIRTKIFANFNIQQLVLFFFSNHEAVANKIRNFLQLEKPEVTLSDDSSDDGFEQIKHGELSGFNEQDIKHESVQSDRGTESTDHDNPAPTTDIDA